MEEPQGLEACSEAEKELEWDALVTPQDTLVNKCVTLVGAGC